MKWCESSSPEDKDVIQNVSSASKIKCIEMGKDFVSIIEEASWRAKSAGAGKDYDQSEVETAEM